MTDAIANQEKQNGKEIAKQENDGQQPIVNENILAVAEKRANQFDRILEFALKSTNDADWVNENGKPYLQSSGAEKVARRFGLKIVDIRQEKVWSEDEKGKFYFYKTTGTIIGGTEPFEAMGIRTSRDKFFARRTNRQGEVYFLPLSEIDEGNVAKASYSNFLVNAITRFLGIRNLSWQQLKESGLNPQNIAKVDYGKKKETSPEDKKKQIKLGNMILELVGQDKKEAKKYLAGITAFKTKDGNQVKGVEHLNMLTGKRLNIIYNKVKQSYIKMFGEDIYQENYGNGKEAQNGNSNNSE